MMRSRDGRDAVSGFKRDTRFQGIVVQLERERGLWSAGKGILISKSEKLEIDLRELAD